MKTSLALAVFAVLLLAAPAARCDQARVMTLISGRRCHGSPSTSASNWARLKVSVPPLVGALAARIGIAG